MTSGDVITFVLLGGSAIMALVIGILLLHGSGDED